MRVRNLFVPRTTERAILILVLSIVTFLTFMAWFGKMVRDDRPISRSRIDLTTPG